MAAKDFLDFMQDAQTNGLLTKEFKGNAISQEALGKFFADKGYTGISPDDCKRILVVLKALSDENKKTVGAWPSAGGGVVESY